MGARSSKNTTQNNRSDGHLLEYFRNTFVRGGGGTNSVPPRPPGLTATGGVISDYTSGPAVYIAHIFTSSGTFSVTAPGGYGDTVEYLVVAGGGGGGSNNTGGGGGAGAILYNTNQPVSTSPGSYTVTVGGGGAGSPTSGSASLAGSNSVFGPGPISSAGGGYGAYGNAGTSG